VKLASLADSEVHRWWSVRRLDVLTLTTGFTGHGLVNDVSVSYCHVETRWDGVWRLGRWRGVLCVLEHDTDEDTQAHDGNALRFRCFSFPTFVHFNDPNSRATCQSKPDNDLHARKME